LRVHRGSNEGWVLGKEPGNYTAPRAAFASKGECDKELMVSWQILQKTQGEDKIYPDGNRIEVVSGQVAGRGYVRTSRTNADGKLVQVQTSSYQCWPDTVDPRGPKGR
jgi:hypothetical protein